MTPTQSSLKGSKATYVHIANTDTTHGCDLLFVSLSSNEKEGGRIEGGVKTDEELVVVEGLEISQRTQRKRPRTALDGGVGVVPDSVRKRFRLA